MGEIRAAAREAGFSSLEDAARHMGAMFGSVPNVQAMSAYEATRGHVSQFMALSFAAFFRVIALEKELAGL